MDEHLGQRAPDAPAVELFVVRADNPGPMTLTGTNSHVLRDEDQVWVVDPGPKDPEHLAELGRPLPKRAPKQPWAFLPAAGGRFALAAIGADRPDGAFGFSLITTQANGVVGRIHDRMPVILPNGDAIGTWLDPDAHRDDLAELLGPLPDERVATRRVSRRVSNARNEGPECLVEAPVEGLGLL